MPTQPFNADALILEEELSTSELSGSINESIGNFNNIPSDVENNKIPSNIKPVAHKDNGFLLLQESDALVSPISVLFTSSYQSLSECLQTLETEKDKIQCIVGGTQIAQKVDHAIAFGQTQQPNVWDYADGVDTLQFLRNLS